MQLFLRAVARGPVPTLGVQVLPAPTLVAEPKEKRVKSCFIGFFRNCPLHHKRATNGVSVGDTGIAHRERLARYVADWRCALSRGWAWLPNQERHARFTSRRRD